MTREPFGPRGSPKPVRLSVAFIVLVAAVSCAPDFAPKPAAAPTPAQTTHPRGADAAKLVFAAGRVSCHDEPGDVWSEGSGDRRGPPRTHPRPAQVGADLSGVSVERYESGMTFVFSARPRIPKRVPLGARLQYSFTASNPRDPDGTVAVSAILLHRRWMIEVRDGDRYTVPPRRPTIVGQVVEIILDDVEVPELMRGHFRWHAFSEWAPAPASPASSPGVYSDFCPNSGLPRFGGTST